MVLLHFQTFTISGFVLIPIHGSIHALQILRITRVLCSTLKGWSAQNVGWRKRLDSGPPCGAAASQRLAASGAPALPPGGHRAIQLFYTATAQLLSYVTSTAVQEKSYYEVWPFITYVSAASLYCGLSQPCIRGDCPAVYLTS